MSGFSKINLNRCRRFEWSQVSGETRCAVVLRCCFAGFQHKRMYQLFVIGVLVVCREGGGLFAMFAS